MLDAKTKKQAINGSRREFAMEQKRGAPFIMASTVLWVMMSIAFLADLGLYTKNLIAMACSALLMPVAMLFGKLIKVDIFSKAHPFSGLSIVAALNQLLYLPIVLWAMYEAPEHMIMIYAMVVGAHFLPYYWIYFSPTYLYAAIIIPIASLILGIYCDQAIVCLAFVLFDTIICASVAWENERSMKIQSAQNSDGSTV